MTVTAEAKIDILPLYITNSQAPGAIGDAISAVPAVAELARSRPPKSLRVYWSAQIVGLFAIPAVDQFLGRPQDEETRSLDIQEIAQGFLHTGIPITEAWARALGMPGLPDDWQWPALWEDIPRTTGLIGFRPDAPFVLASPFSYSDLGTGCKVWPKFKWLGLVESLQATGLQVGLLCHGQDPADAYFDFHVRNRPLPEVANWMRDAAAVVTVDNGMNWMAQATGARHALITAAAHPPAWSSNPGPNARNVADARMASIREVLAAVTDLAERA